MEYENSQIWQVIFYFLKLSRIKVIREVKIFICVPRETILARRLGNTALPRSALSGQLACSLTCSFSGTGGQILRTFLNLTTTGEALHWAPMWHRGIDTNGIHLGAAPALLSAGTSTAYLVFSQDVHLAVDPSISLTSKGGGRIQSRLIWPSLFPATGTNPGTDIHLAPKPESPVWLLRGQKLCLGHWP